MHERQRRSVQTQRTSKETADHPEQCPCGCPSKEQCTCSEMAGPATLQTSVNGEIGLHKLLASLDQVRNKLEAKDDDFMFLKTLLQSPDVQALFQVHRKVSHYENQEDKPILKDALQLADEIYDDLRNRPVSSDIKELTEILWLPHMRALLTAHDKVASKDFLPKLPDIPHEVDEDEETVKIVQLVKNNEPLGATIKSNEQSGTIVIARVMLGGAADRSGLIRVGDEVHEVNGINVRGKQPNDVVNILSQIQGTITFKLVPADIDIRPARESKVRVRAHFDFDPMEDKVIPCREAGLPFSKGDILHIVSQDDPDWWQARHENGNIRAGLIPGRQLQERSAGHTRMSRHRSDKDQGCKSPLRNTKRPKKTKKIMYHAQQNDEFDAEEIMTYEEVAKLYPRVGIFRPIILIGAPGVGRNELKRRLIATNPDHYKTTIPYTSRPKKPSEVEGKEYYFVSRQAMENNIQNGKFVEYGEYKGNFYGTMIDTIKSIINSGCVGIMNPHPQALKMLRIADIKPYIIFIKPPSLDRLRSTRINANAKSTFDETNSRGFTEDEFHDILHSAHRIETVYSHYFDFTIVNEDLTQCFNDLLAVSKRIEQEPQWVPASWVQ